MKSFLFIAISSTLLGLAADAQVKSSRGSLTPWGEANLELQAILKTNALASIKLTEPFTVDPRNRANGIYIFAAQGQCVKVQLKSVQSQNAIGNTGTTLLVDSVTNECK
jgi:hypothetical protein